MNRSIAVIAMLAMSTLAFAQVGSTITEGAKATGEKAKQYVDEARASVSSQPDKTVYKAKAQVHKAKAEHHAKAASDAAKEIPK